jgi:hypothetical protein
MFMLKKSYHPLNKVRAVTSTTAIVGKLKFAMTIPHNPWCG